MCWDNTVKINNQDFELYYFALFDMIFKKANPDYEDMYIVKE